MYLCLKEFFSNLFIENMKKIKHFFIPLAILTGFLLLIIVASRYFYTRFDLTSDKRYTLSETTQEVLQKVQHPIIIDVLMKGNIPAEYKRLQSETLQLLEEYRSKNKNIIFKFSNPLNDANNADKILQELTYYGLLPVQITTAQEGKTSQEYIFPWAIVNSGEKSEKVALLKNKLGASDQERIQFSVQNLEYAFTDAIHKILLQKQKNIAILKSNGTLSDIQIADFLQLEGEYYNLAPFTLDSVATNPEKTLKQLSDYHLFIIPKPTLPFSDAQKQIIDQYIMQGGRVLWLIDQVAVNLEDMYENNGRTMAMPLDLNLGDLFFKYGFRINYDLVNDLYFTQIVVAQGDGSQTRYTPIPWLYNPMILPKNNHLINNNLDAIRLQFASGIDTLTNSIKKHILLTSSALSKLEGTPREIRLETSSKSMDKNGYVQGNYPIAVLLEGNFTSVYKNRVKPIDLQNTISDGKYSKMIVISDGDIIRNDISKGEPLELGYDKWTNNYYDNKAFLQNCVNYLLDDTNFLQLRNKKVSLAFLDKKKLTNEYKQKWQILTLFLPILLIILLGVVIQFWYRKTFVSAKKTH